MCKFGFATATALGGLLAVLGMASADTICDQADKKAADIVVKLTADEKVGPRGDHASISDIFGDPVHQAGGITSARA